MPQAKWPLSRTSIVDSDWEVHKKLNNFVENQIVGNISTCVSQENHDFCYTSAFPRFYQDLVVVILSIVWEF